MTRNQFVFDAIGTRWTIDIFIPLVFNKQKNLFGIIKKRIDDFDKTYSRFRKDSLVTEISQKKGSFIFPEDSQKLFSFYKKMYAITDHKVTPLIGQTLSAAGYDASYSLKPRILKKPDDWDKTLDYHDNNLKTKKPVTLDFGAAGKGYLVDIIANLLNKNGISDFCIDAGGDIFYQTTKKDKMRIGLEHPDDPSQVIGTVKIKNQSICGSSINRRNWGKYHHIINPYSLSSPKKILSTWAVADTALLADGMTTCLFFKSGEKLKKHFNFEYFILFDNYTYEMSSNFAAEVYTDVGTISK